VVVETPPGSRTHPTPERQGVNVKDETHTLYRFYGSDERLLYIGISVNPWSRFKQHRDDKQWWDDIAQITMEKYPSRETVLEAERRAIGAEKPEHNVVHNRGRSYATAPANAHTWRFRGRNPGDERTGELYLTYQVELDPIGDEYDPFCESADDTFWHWRDAWLRYRRRLTSGELLAYPVSVVPISWAVTGVSTFESASPRNYWWFENRSEWWGDFYTRPINATTGLPLTSVVHLPIEKKVWTPKRSAGGGFITAATGWTPTPLQPWVDIDSLAGMAAARRSA
jgi:hypothetical protein